MRHRKARGLATIVTIATIATALVAGDARGVGTLRERGRLVAFHAHTGERAWKVEGSPPGRYFEIHAVTPGVVIGWRAGCDADAARPPLPEYVAFDVRSGEQLWQKSAPGSYLSYGATRAVSVVVTQQADAVSAFDTRTGRLQWRVQEGGYPAVTAVPDAPVLLLDTVGTDERSLTALAARDGAPLWQVGLPSNYEWRVAGADVTSVVLVGATIFGVKNHLMIVLDVSSGAERFRREVQSDGGQLARSVILVGNVSDQLFDRTRIALDVVNGSELWRSDRFDWIGFAPSDGGTLLAGTRTPSTLSALDPGSGVTRWQRAVEAEEYGVASNGEVLAMTGPNRLFALDASTGRELWRRPRTGFFSGTWMTKEGLLLVGKSCVEPDGG